MSKPVSGLVYYIINQEFGLAWDLFQGNMDFVVGARPNKQSSQKVRSTAIDDPSNLSNLCSISSQWRFLEIDGFWVIENISNLQFANVEHADPILPGVKVITANPRNWELIPDPEFDGWR